MRRSIRSGIDRLVPPSQGVLHQQLPPLHRTVRPGPRAARVAVARNHKYGYQDGEDERNDRWPVWGGSSPKILGGFAPSAPSSLSQFSPFSETEKYELHVGLQATFEIYH